MPSFIHSKLLTAFLLGSSCVAVSAQAIPTDFDVASIHMVEDHTVADQNRGSGAAYLGPYGTNRFTARNVPLEFLISIAYGVDYNRLVAKDDWLDTQLYDVIAEVDPTVKLTREQTQPLLQHLLEKRFHLKTHTEETQVAGYALVAAKGGPKLTHSPEPKPEPHAQILSNGLQARGVTVGFFAGILERPTGKPVVDQTGIAGTFDFNLSYAPENSVDSSLPSIFTAVQDQLGLKLLPQKVPIQRFVIDHVERIPQEN
jgi:uncharacterized protein (TIGR03435 family)